MLAPAPRVIVLPPMPTNNIIVVPKPTQTFTVEAWGGSSDTVVVTANTATINTIPGMEVWAQVRTSYRTNRPASDPSAPVYFIARQHFATLTWDVPTLTNYLNVPVVVQQSTDLAHWTNAYSTNWVTLTNPTDSKMFFRFQGQMDRSFAP